MSLSAFGGDEQNGEMRGVSVGIVTNNRDPERLGRVKLTYPWRDVDDESDWARTAVPMAGEGRGTYFLPEVDDEVLVAFEDGDIHHPYVLGSLWNGNDTPPAENADGHNDVRKITSRNGHEVELDDSDRGGRVVITTAGGHRIVLDDESGGERITIADRTGENKIEFDSVGNEIAIASAARVSVESTLLELKGNGNVNIEASGVLSLKGSLVAIN